MDSFAVVSVLFVHYEKIAFIRFSINKLQNGIILLTFHIIVINWKYTFCVELNSE